MQSHNAAFVWIFSSVCCTCLILGDLENPIGDEHRGVLGLDSAFDRYVCDFLFKLPACVDAKLHWLHLFGFSPACVAYV